MHIKIYVALLSKVILFLKYFLSFIKNIIKYIMKYLYVAYLDHYKLINENYFLSIVVYIYNIAFIIIRQY